MAHPSLLRALFGSSIPACRRSAAAPQRPLAARHGRAAAPRLRGAKTLAETPPRSQICKSPLHQHAMGGEGGEQRGRKGVWGPCGCRGAWVGKVPLLQRGPGILGAGTEPGPATLSHLVTVTVPRAGQLLPCSLFPELTPPQHLVQHPEQESSSGFSGRRPSLPAPAGAAVSLLRSHWQRGQSIAGGFAMGQDLL